MNKVVLVLLVFVLASCASIMKGSKQLVTINCNVEGASIYLDDKEVGVTPFTGEIKKNGKMLRVEKEGYKSYNVALNKDLEGAFWGNIITGGTLGSTTDMASGAAYKYSPSSFQIELVAEGSSLNEFKQLLEVKKFAMINMSNIAIDVSNNDGPYLKALMELVNLNDSKVIQDYLIESQGDQVAFGKLMVGQLSI